MGALGGIGAIILGIIGLAGLIPAELAGIASIVVGASLLIEGGAIVSNLRQVYDRFGVTSEVGTSSTEFFFAGVTGVVLGILALLNIYPAVLMAVAVIVFGAALLLGAGSMSLGSGSGTGTVDENRSWALARAAVATIASGEAFIGMAALVLGILAVLGIAAVTLELVAFLCLGAGIFFCGSTVGGKAMQALQHTS
jgi:hypothetical protein